MKAAISSQISITDINWEKSLISDSSRLGINSRLEIESILQCCTTHAFAYLVYNISIISHIPLLFLHSLPSTQQPVCRNMMMGCWREPQSMSHLFQLTFNSRRQTTWIQSLNHKNQLLTSHPSRWCTCLTKCRLLICSCSLLILQFQLFHSWLRTRTYRLVSRLLSCHRQ